MKRKTGLVIDENGDAHILVLDPCEFELHSAEEIVELFLRENEIEECEVFIES